MRIKDTKANKIFMLVLLIIIMIVYFDSKYSNSGSSTAEFNFKNDINIETISANINIWVDNKYDTAQVIYNSKNNGYLDVEERDGTTNIKEKVKKKFINFVFDNETPTLSIYLPSNELNNLRINSISGNIEAYENLNFKNLELFSTSGNINLLDVNSEKDLSIKTISGEIFLNNGNADVINISSTSGSIETYNLDSSDTSLSSISGEISVNDITTDKLKIKTTSSDVDLDYADVKDKIDISTVSGEIDGIFKDVEYKYNIDTISGEININEAEYEKKYSTPTGIPFNLKTVSGDLNINTK